MITLLSFLKDLVIGSVSKAVIKVFFKLGKSNLFLSRKSLQNDCYRNIHLLKKELKKLSKKRRTQTCGLY